MTDLDQLAFENAPMGLALTENRIIRACNQTFVEMFGFKKSQLIGQSFRLLYGTDQEFHQIRDIGLEPLRRSLPYTDERLMRRSDGTPIWCRFRARTLTPETPLARIVDLTVTAGDPVIMLEEPLFATDKALKKAGLSIDDIDLYEVNEAFAPVPMAWLKHVGADPDKLNVNGGAIALGHPLGASGTKLMSTLVHALKARGKKYGLQTMCEGGGVANVTIIEAL